MNALLIITILALAAPIFGEETADKRQDKRGVVNVGYGGHYPAAFGAHGLTGYGGYGAYGGYGHGYVPSAPLYGIGHGLGHGIGHGIAAAPSIAHAYTAPSIAHAYTAPVSHYPHGYNSASLLAAPWRAGYNGLHGAGFGHGIGYVNGW